MCMIYNNYMHYIWHTFSLIICKQILLSMNISLDSYFKWLMISLYCRIMNINRFHKIVEYEFLFPEEGWEGQFPSSCCAVLRRDVLATIQSSCVLKGQGRVCGAWSCALCLCFIPGRFSSPSGPQVWWITAFHGQHWNCFHQPSVDTHFPEDSTCECSKVVCTLLVKSIFLTSNRTWTVSNLMIISLGTLGTVI